ncbi:hypothetical protein L2089_15265 [Paenibacillus hunanensis]|uniref:hypothetical protein n=1 Tax=Paenibacillus hunanensis TaxID=539262 RepID=UPI0020274125|nr:hypothetical protein [Paenibacillus hunanensis]MCL9662052.1 hypothetical protein [Paenibacillus hunanensis]
MINFGEQLSQVPIFNEQIDYAFRSALTTDASLTNTDVMAQIEVNIAGINEVQITTKAVSVTNDGDNIIFSSSYYKRIKKSPKGAV